MPTRCAASAFSLSPPIGSTRPRRVISPVMARSLRTGRRVSAEIIASAIVMPADGPSFGMAPSGRWMWMSRLSGEVVGQIQLVGARADVGERGARRLLHHIAKLARDHQAALARHRHHLDRQQRAAVRGPREAGRDADLAHAPSPCRASSAATPRYCSTFFSVRRMRASGFETMRRAALRQIVASWRSRLRTPASRV